MIISARANASILPSGEISRESSTPSDTASGSGDPDVTFEPLMATRYTSAWPLPLRSEVKVTHFPSADQEARNLLAVLDPSRSHSLEPSSSAM